MRRFMATSLLAVMTAILAPALAAGQEQRKVPPKPDEQVPIAREAEELTIPDGSFWLGTVRIPVAVLADGKPLAAGQYRVRMTGEHAEPKAIGQLERLERWVEFVRGGKVFGRAMAPVVPKGSVERVADARPPRPGGHRIERLKEDDYLRLWFNHRGDQVLIYLPIQAAAAR